MANTDEKIPVEDLTEDQKTVDQAYEEGELSEQERDDMTQINYLLGRR